MRRKKNEWDVGADDDGGDDDDDDGEDINKYVDDNVLLRTCSSSLLQRNPP